jgi:hypothetical protein
MTRLISGLLLGLLVVTSVSADPKKDKPGKDRGNDKYWKERDKAWEKEREQARKDQEKYWKERRKTVARYRAWNDDWYEPPRPPAYRSWSYEQDYPSYSQRDRYYDDYRPPMDRRYSGRYYDDRGYYEDRYYDRGYYDRGYYDDDGYYRSGRGAVKGSRIGARIGELIGGPEGAAIGADIGRDIGTEVDR